MKIRVIYKFLHLIVIAALFIGSFLVFRPAKPARAATITVLNSSNSGADSLRQGGIDAVEIKADMEMLHRLQHGMEDFIDDGGHAASIDVGHGVDGKMDPPDGVPLAGIEFPDGDQSAVLRFDFRGKAEQMCEPIMAQPY